MTDMLHEIEQDLTQHTPAKMSALPVKAVDTKPDATEYRSTTSYLLLGNEAAQQILGYDKNRKRAIIAVAPGFLNNNVTGYVLIGSRNQIAAGPAGTQPPNGMVLISGQTISVESMPDLWLIGDGSHSLTVSVLDERYMPDSEREDS